MPPARKNRWHFHMIPRGLSLDCLSPRIPTVIASASEAIQREKRKPGIRVVVPIYIRLQDDEMCAIKAKHHTSPKLPISGLANTHSDDGGGIFLSKTVIAKGCWYKTYRSNLYPDFDKRGEPRFLRLVASGGLEAPPPAERPWSRSVFQGNAEWPNLFCRVSGR